jgi:glutathione S-transferase
MSRKLYIAQRSPFARKVRILLLEKQLPFDLIQEDLSARSKDFVTLSPLGKVPLLVEEDGECLFDSTVIAEYLEDRYPEPPMFGEGVEERLRHRVLDELADTVAEQAITLFFERGTSADREKAERMLDRALDELCARIDRGQVPASFGVGHAAVLSALDYLALRLGRTRIDARPQLALLVDPHRQRASVIEAEGPRP